MVRRKKTLQISVPALLKQRETNRFIQRLKTHCTHVHTDKNPVRGKCQTWRLASKDKSISERISLAVNLAVGKTEKQARWVTHTGAQVEGDSLCTHSLSPGFGCEYARGQGA